MQEERLSVKAASVSLGVTPRRVRQLIEAGRLPAQRLTGTNIFTIDPADSEGVRVRPNGRPPKVKVSP